MKKLFIITLLAAGTIAAKAQTTNTAITEHDPAVKAKDADIKTHIIDPAEQAANGEAPDWENLKQTITQQYDAVTADRTVTKAKIYFYYAKDWPAFCAGIVHYTDNWELANDFPLLNKNAQMILKNSTDSAQLKAAQLWAKMAMNGDTTGDTDYKATYDAITHKLTGK